MNDEELDPVNVGSVVRVRSNYLTMLPDRKIVTRVGDMAVVNRMAVLTLMQDEVWSKNPWIMNYKGGES